MGFFSGLSLPLTSRRNHDIQKHGQGVPTTVFLAQRASAGHARLGFFRFSGGFFLHQTALVHIIAGVVSYPTGDFGSMRMVYREQGGHHEGRACGGAL